MDGDESNGVLKEGERAVVYRVGYVPDTGDMELDISRTHQDFIVWLSRNGGETTWDASKVREDVTEHVLVLVDLGVITGVALTVGGRVYLLRLTDLGRNAATVIRKSRGIR